jgi:Flp pilus assembly protein TadG
MFPRGTFSSKTPMTMARRPRQRRRHGMVLVYAVVLLVVFCAFVSLGVDWGRVQLCKTELSVAADAAARAAAAQLPDVSAAQAAAVDYAGYNQADGTGVVLGAGDIEFGSWDSSTRTFTALSGAAQSGANAVRVTARRTAAGGNAVNLTFGRIVGQNTCDVHAVSIATVSGGGNYPITGLSGITAHDRLFVASYNSSMITTPDHTIHNNNGSLASNGAIVDQNNNGSLYGNMTLGPSASNAGVSVSGSTTNLAANIPTPATPPMTPVTNPGGVSQAPNLTTGQSVTWPGGTYYFSSFTAANGVTIQFTGPATVYMNGNVTLHDSDAIVPSGSRPANLVWYQAAGTTFVGHDALSLTGEFYGPSATFTVHDRDYVAGSLFFQTLTFHDQCDVYYDESITSLPGGVGGGSAKIALVQ